MLVRTLKRLREQYYVSNLLAALARPLHRLSRSLNVEIEKKVRKNGTVVRLPNGVTLRWARDSGIGLSSALFWRGLDGYETYTCRTLRFFFARCDTFVDAGANYGYYSLIGALLNPKLRVVAFEPVPEIYRGLLRNIRLNQLEGRVDAHQEALSDRSGEATFYLPTGDSRDQQSTGTLAPDSWQRDQNSTTQQVKVVRFDDFKRRLPGRVDLVKIDVEDFEAAVLSGMTETIIQDRPFIVCEVLPRAHRNRRTLEILQSLNYSAYWITSAGFYLRVFDFEFERETCDFLFAPVAAKPRVITDLELLWPGKEHKSGEKL